MGLCKCPKRLITNQFCFQHRVNVCENCMVSSHSKCIVQSYLQWLNDSDYNSDCTLCNTELEKGDCVRLTCFHVFHWNCLNGRQGSLPDNTAPGGHVCPICSDSIFPPSNLVSPVADILRSRLGQVNWGRNELGLPLFKEEKKQFKESKTYYNNTTTSNKLNEAFNNKTNSNNLASPHSVLQIDSFSAPSTSETFQANSRRPVFPKEERSLLGSDRDDNKYKRKTPGEIFSKWSRRLYSPSSRPFWRRTWFLVCFGIFMFLLLIFVMAKLGRENSDDDDDSDGSFLGNINLPHREII